jgi:hypothetical protein
MNVWQVSCTKGGNFMLFYRRKWWVPVVDFFGSPLLRFGFTYRLANVILDFGESGLSLVYCGPLPEDFRDPDVDVALGRIKRFDNLEEFLDELG